MRNHKKSHNTKILFHLEHRVSSRLTFGTGLQQENGTPQASRLGELQLK